MNKNQQNLVLENVLNNNKFDKIRLELNQKIETEDSKLTEALKRIMNKIKTRNREWFDNFSQFNIQIFNEFDNLVQDDHIHQLLEKELWDLVQSEDIVEELTSLINSANQNVNNNNGNRESVRDNSI